MSHKRSIFIVVITGMLVFGIPLLFLNILSNNIVERAREAALENLRETIFQELQSLQNKLKPEAYVKHLIKKAHSQLLPEITPDLLRLRPDRFFGKEQFNDALPEKFASFLKEKDVSPLLVVCNSVEFSDMSYWFSHDLNEQVGTDSRNLAFGLSNMMLCLASELYSMNYKNPLEFNSINNPMLVMIGSAHFASENFFFRYLSRFQDPKRHYDDVIRYYTDYFGKQFLYSYTYCCISPVNVHGAYTIFVKQNSLSTKKIIDFACRQDEQSPVNCRIISDELHKDTGFMLEKDSLVYRSYIPTHFYSHIVFFNKNAAPDEIMDPGRLRVEIRAGFPQELNSQLSINRIVKFSSIGFCLFFTLFSVHTLLFGLRLPVSIRKKLALVLAVLVFLPISASGLLSFYLLSGFGKIVENLLAARVENKLGELMRLEDENRGRMTALNLKFKQLFQQSNDSIENFYNKENLNRLLPISKNWIVGSSLMSESGTLYELNRGPGRSTQLHEGILGKYLFNQSLAKVSGAKAQEMNLKINLTMGIIESFLTPEMEEATTTREGTLQREITHSLDTNLATFMIFDRENGENAIIMNRFNYNELQIFSYLVDLNLYQPQIFAENSELFDLKAAVRLRKHTTLTNLAWPADSIFDPEILDAFIKAMNNRAPGQKIVRENANISIFAWKFRDHHLAIYAAVGKSRRLNLINLAISMVLPFSLGYSVIVLISISRFLSLLLLRPVNILQQGIGEINQNNFGLTIREVEVEEIGKVVSAFNEMSIALKQKELIGRYVSDKLLEDLNNATRQAQTQNLEVTFLASDIRGFTNITESYPPFEVVDMLNAYFTLMEKAVTENNGVIDKYIGDAIQAIFYEESGYESAPIRACKAALTMREYLLEFNLERRANGYFTIENGIGIASGKVVAGTIGSDGGRKIYTIYGEAVKTATKLEAMSPVTPSKIVVCNRTFVTAHRHFHFLQIDEHAYSITEVKVED